MTWRESFTCVGDSQLLRFCNYLSIDSAFCVSGQTIGEIRLRLKQCSSLPTKVIALVGTNDLRRKSVTWPALRKDYLALIRHLLRRTERLVLVVTPVIPYLANSSEHLDLVERLQHLAYSLRPRLSLVDLRTVSTGSVWADLFERRYPSGRPDNLHLNRRAFDLLRAELDKLLG